MQHNHSKSKHVGSPDKFWQAFNKLKTFTERFNKEFSDSEEEVGDKSAGFQSEEQFEEMKNEMLADEFHFNQGAIRV